MHSRKPVRKMLNRLSKRIIALVCAVCFFVVFLIVAALHSDHKDSDSFSLCPVTSEKICYCESESSVSLTGISPIDGAYVDSQSSAHIKAACHTCALVVKTSSQLRQMTIQTSTILIAYQVMLVLLALSFLSPLYSSSSPTELKVKISN